MKRFIIVWHIQVFDYYMYASNLYHTYIIAYIIVIKTQDSELQGQEEAGLCGKQVSYLHVALL